jgi:hypothetical protein
LKNRAFFCFAFKKFLAQFHQKYHSPATPTPMLPLLPLPKSSETAQKSDEKSLFCQRSEKRLAKTGNIFYI